MSKDPLAEPVYREWFRMLDEDKHATFASVAQWLNATNVAVTKWKNGNMRWDGKMVARHTYNTLLKGERERNRRKTRRINKTGKYVAVKAAPEDLRVRKVPHLAFFDEAYYDRVIAKLKACNGNCHRSDDPADGPCLHRPRTGQVTFCGICGRNFVWGGHGQTNALMCRGAREHVCWNGATFNGPLAARITAFVVQELEKWWTSMRCSWRCSPKGRRLDQAREAKLQDLRRSKEQVEKEVANIIKFIKEGKAVGGSSRSAGSSGLFPTPGTGPQRRVH